MYWLAMDAYRVRQTAVRDLRVEPLSDRVSDFQMTELRAWSAECTECKFRYGKARSYLAGEFLCILYK